MKKQSFTFEWNMHLAGFVVTAECGADANMQFNNCVTAPVKEFQFGVDGGYIHDDFTSEMLELAYEQAQKEEEVMSIEKDLRELYEYPALVEKLWAMSMVSQGDIEEMLQEHKNELNGIKNSSHDKKVELFLKCLNENSHFDDFGEFDREGSARAAAQFAHDNYGLNAHAHSDQHAWKEAIAVWDKV